MGMGYRTECKFWHFSAGLPGLCDRVAERNDKPGTTPQLRSRASRWPVSAHLSAEQRSPFGPAPLQSLHPYYELLRPCAPLRYSGPCGVRRLDVSLNIGATGSHVPYKSLVELRAAYMPDAARAGFRVLPS